MRRNLLLAEFASTPWALTPDYLSLMAGVLARWALDEPISAGIRDQINQDKEARSNRQRQQPKSGAVAVIPVYGVLTQRPPQDISGSGGTSTMNIARAVKSAANDPAVSQILLDIDSPGGSVYGMVEVGDEIYQARAKKPVVAIANSLSASAAYWLGSQASEFYIAPGGEVGSIGVYTAHQYLGKYLEEIGIEMTLISAGKYKVEGNQIEPLGDEAKAAIQSRVDDYYSAFVAAVARGRGVTAAQVKSGMGQGRVLGENDALSEKMVDGVIAYDALVDKMMAASAPTRSKVASARRELALL